MTICKDDIFVILGELKQQPADTPQATAAKLVPNRLITFCPAWRSCAGGWAGYFSGAGTGAALIMP